MPCPLTPFFKQIYSGEKVLLKKKLQAFRTRILYIFSLKKNMEQTNCIWLLPLQTFHASFSKTAETKIVSRNGSLEAQTTRSRQSEEKVSMVPETEM
jgi:hypothetical protein